MNGSRMTQAAVTARSVAPSSAGPSASPWLEIEQPEMRRSGSRLMGSRPSSRQDMPTCSMPPSSGSGKTLLSPVASLPMGSPIQEDCQRQRAGHAVAQKAAGALQGNLHVQTGQESGHETAMKKAGCSCEQPAFREFWSGRSDSNTRPLAPHASTLPDCATPRQTHSITASFPETQILEAGCVLFPVAPTPCLACPGLGTRGRAGRSPQRLRKCRRQAREPKP